MKIHADEKGKSKQKPDLALCPPNFTNGGERSSVELNGCCYNV